MQIFGRDVPAPEDLWQLYSQIVQTPELWKTQTFKAAATQCGLRAVTARRGYFSFSGKHHVTGQAPHGMADHLIEEIRFFIGQAPKDLDLALYEKERQKIGQLAWAYCTLFRQNLGEPRKANANDIFEYNDHRVRVLAAECVWVVISNLSVIKQLPHDYFAPKNTESPMDALLGAWVKTGVPRSE
jgi:hypothetical protein